VRVAVLADIHGNLPALEAALADVERADVDRVVLAGDVVSGPMPGEVLDELSVLGSDALWVRGNADRELGPWVEERLTEEQVAFLRGLPDVQRVDVDGLGPTLVCHGSPRSDEELLTVLTPDERLREALAGVSEDVVVCGHTHHQFDRTVDGTRLVNAGSVGMPYEGRPGAYWVLLGPDVEFRRADYDFGAAAEAWLASGYPDAPEYVQNVYVEPVTARDAAEHFERVAEEEA
jgi:putative phosphoesterase